MSQIDSALGVSLSEVLGLNAAVVVFLMWRTQSFRAVLAQLQLLFQFWQTGFAPAWFTRAAKVTIAEASVGLLVLLAGLFLFRETFHYVRHANDLIADAVTGALQVQDFGIIALRLQHVHAVQDRVVWLSIATLTMTLAGWAFEVVFGGPQLSSADVPEQPHPYALPRDWRKERMAMWERRIQIADRNQTKRPTTRAYDPSLLREEMRTQNWRYSWRSWTLCVVHYHVAVSAELNGSERKPIPDLSQYDSPQA